MITNLDAVGTTYSGEDMQGVVGWRGQCGSREPEAQKRKKNSEKVMCNEKSSFPALESVLSWVKYEILNAKKLNV